MGASPSSAGSSTPRYVAIANTTTLLTVARRFRAVAYSGPASHAGSRKCTSTASHGERGIDTRLGAPYLLMGTRLSDIRETTFLHVVVRSLSTPYLRARTTTWTFHAVYSVIHFTIYFTSV